MPPAVPDSTASPMHPALRRDWVILGALTFCFACGFAVYSGIFYNFIREDLGVDPAHLGVLESLREIPGLLTAFVAGSLALLAETRLAGLAIALCGVGVAVTGQATGFGSLVAVTLLWSIGGHVWFSLSAAVTMALAQGRDGGRHLGRMSGIGSLGTLLSLALTAGFTHWYKLAHPAARPPYAGLFVVAGGLMLVAAVLATMLSERGSSSGARAKVVFRREYRLYYVLAFLEGCRRQIFTTFAPFVLIVVFHVPVQSMLLLAFVNAALLTVVSPLVGRLVDHHGERRVLTVYYASLILVFLGYATLARVELLYGLYLLDNLLFCCGVGLTTYLNSIVRPGDLTPSLAMGTTWNHVAAVVVPVTGGVLWKQLHNYRIPFWIGVGVLVLSLLAIRRLPVRETD